MITNKQNKLIKSLHLKKYRKEYGMFLVEGQKSVMELLLSSYEIVFVIATQRAYHVLQPFNTRDVPIYVEDEKLINTLSQLDTGSPCIAVAKIFAPEVSHVFQLPAIALYHVQDPGNLGTIVRAADWFGITSVYCSENCVDFYNLKTISATMGSFTRVVPKVMHLETLFSRAIDNGVQIFGAYMQGISVYELKNKNAIYVFGNEASGIGDEMEKYLTKKFCIPKVGGGESLNVAMAACITMSYIASGH